MIAEVTPLIVAALINPVFCSLRQARPQLQDQDMRTAQARRSFFLIAELQGSQNRMPPESTSSVQSTSASPTIRQLISSS